MFSSLFGGEKKRNAELFEAASKGNVDGVKQALKKGADINALNLEYRETPLHVAIDNSHIAVVELLLASGANPNIISNQNLTPLILAAAMGDSSLPIVELLIAGNADLSLAPTAGSNAGGAPIHIATSSGANAILKRLLAAGVPALTMSNGSSMLHLAAIGGNLDTIKILDSTGFSVDAVDNKSRTPLHIAAIVGNSAVAEELMNRGANLEVRDDQDCTPLMHASIKNQAKVVDLLLNHGANPDIVVKTGDSELTPLYTAAINGYDEVVKLLLASGAPVNKKVGGLHSVVDLANQAGHNKIVSMLKDAVNQVKAAKKLAKPDAKIEKLWKELIKSLSDFQYEEIKLHSNSKLFTQLPIDNQLLVCSALCDKDRVKNLLTQGANPNHQFKEVNGGIYSLLAAAVGCERLFFAMKGKAESVEAQKAASAQLATVQCLLEAKSDTNLQCNDGVTCLMSIIPFNKHYSVLPLIKLLFDNGANPNLKTLNEVTPLILATLQNDQAIVDILLEAGADINEITSTNSLGAFGYAVDKNYMDLAFHLIQKGAKPEYGSVETLPLAVAEWGSLELIKAIEENGGNIVPDAMQGRIAFVAARNKDCEVLDYLLNHGADVNHDNDFSYTPLILASLTNHVELVKRYIDRGDDLNTQDVDHETALSLAVEKDHPTIVALLRQHHAQVNKYPEMSEEAAMLQAAKDGALGSILNLYDYGISINIEDENGNTPIILATMAGHLGVVRTLYHLGADINHQNHADESATAIAKNANNQLILNTMKEFGAVDVFEGAMKVLAGKTAGIYDFGMMISGRLTHPYKDRPPYDNIDDEADAESDEVGLENELVSEMLNQLEELLSRKNIAEKLPPEHLKVLHEKIDRIRHGDPASILEEEIEELKELVELFSSVPEADEDLPEIFIAAAEGDIKAFRSLLKSGVDIKSSLADGTTLLMTATEHGNENIVAELIKSGADVNQVRQDSFSALLIACFIGHEVIVQILIKAGADVNMLYSIGSGHGEVSGCTALYIASQRGHITICQQLLKKNSDANAMNSIGYTPLMAAIKSGHEDVAIFLLKAGANPDPEVVITSEIDVITSFTPLTLAASNEINGIVGELLKRKVDVNKPSSDGWTALKYAAKDGNVEIVKMLLKADASVEIADSDGWTPLMSAAGEGHAKVVILLLNQGANPNCITLNEDPVEAGRTPLMDASLNGFDDIVKALLKAGANPNLVSGSGTSALYDAVLKRHLSTTKLLLNAGADPNIHCDDDLPIIAVAALGDGDDGLYPSPEIVSLLLKYNVNTDFNFSGVSLRTVVQQQGNQEILDLLNMHMGADEIHPEMNDPVTGEQLVDAILSGDFGDEDTLRKLLEAGADPNALCNGVTPLFYACGAGLSDIISLLIQHNANPNLANKFGLTPLHIAAMGGAGKVKHVKQQIVDGLIYAAGANIFARNDYGLLPYDIALNYGHLELAKFFIKEMNRLSEKINKQDDFGRTVLMTAVQGNDTKLVKEYVTQEIDLNRRDLTGQSALSLAVSIGSNEIAAFLLDAGAESLDCTGLESVQAMLKAATYGATGTVLKLYNNGVSFEVTDDMGNTPIILAAEKGHLATVMTLLHKGALIGHRNNDGNSAFHMAEVSGKKLVLKCLAQFGGEDSFESTDNKDAGDDVDNIATEAGSNLLSAVVAGDIKKVMELIHSGVDINYLDEDGRSPLAIALMGLADESVSRRYRRNIDQVIDYLLSQQANPNVGNITPLMLAAAFKKLHVVNSMIKHGAVLNHASDDGATALFAASIKSDSGITSEDEKCAIALIEAGSDLSCRHESGATALQAAAESGFNSVVRAILERAPELIQTHDNDEFTPLMAAARAGHDAVVCTLLKFGADPSVKDSEGLTAADYANQNGHKEIAEMIT